MAQTSERIRTAEGNRLFVTHRPGTGTPILLLNSIGADHTMWDAVRDRLTQPSVAYDTRGHGKSDVSPGRVLIDDLARDAVAVMDATGLDRAILCGLSMGGPTAMQVAAEVPDRVAGLALANTSTHFPPPARWRERAAALRDGGLPNMVQPTLDRWLSEEWRLAHPEAAARVGAMILATPAEGYAAACAALETADLRAALAGWSGATLIIAGQRDQSTPPAAADAMQEIRPNAMRVTLDTAHISAIEDPDGFAQALAAFAATLA